MDEVEDMSMEDLAMSGSKIDKKARIARETKREHIRKLKRLAGLDQWENEDELYVPEVGESLMKMVKFFKDPMVKGQFSKADYKMVHNGLVDVIKTVEKLETQEEAKLLKRM